MNETNRSKDLRDRLSTFGIGLACIVIDVLFLATWTILQWGLNEYVIKPLRLAGIHHWVLLAFQGIFGISTLAVVVVYVWEDITVMILRARKRIQVERKK